MKEKLEYLLRTKSLTATTLARLLEIQPSGISHILSGRNKPSFDLVVKILRAFPDINPDWLILDDERVYRDEVPSSSATHTTPRESEQPRSVSLFAATENNTSTTRIEEQKNEQPFIFPSAERGVKTVERVIVLYSDKSFESYGR
ncbi:MAG: helix-turn-helix transcriptional regulator [Alistipes sp.]|nr:helix-turn-helix transcriptional regulator [Alistipes sp.]